MMVMLFKNNLQSKNRLALFLAMIFSVSVAWAQEDLRFCQEAEIYLKKNKLDEAVPLYESCLKYGNLSSATVGIINRNLGVVYFNKKEFSRSINYFNEAIKLNKIDPWDDLVSRGNSWASSGSLNRALEDYDEALRLRPNFALASFNRGIANERFNQIDQAKNDFLNALDKGFRSPLLSARLSFYKLVLKENSQVDPEKDFQSNDEYVRFVSNFINIEHNRNLCSREGIATAAFVFEILTGPDSKRYKAKNRKEVAKEIYTAFPCPFNPYRPELRLVTKQDLMGTWLFSNDSQKYRFGQKSMAWQMDSRAQIKCELVGFYPDGEMRTLALSGAGIDCNISNGNVLEPARQLPKVSVWEVIDEGRVGISRIDIKNYVEDWDIFLATSDFVAAGLEVKKGDLVGYLRKENGSDLNASMAFRHLKRLSQD